MARVIIRPLYASALILAHAPAQVSATGCTWIYLETNKEEEEKKEEIRSRTSLCLARLAGLHRVASPNYLFLFAFTGKMIRPFTCCAA